MSDISYPSNGRSIAYQPALDGVRALAVLAVLLFHGGVTGFEGGYLGVSVFFTLSGYLITTLLVAEVSCSERIALAQFYARRARRLLPAGVFVVAVIAAMTAITDWFDAIDQLRVQLVGSLLQVANWVFLANEGSYQDLLERSADAASPVEHYWSLAIEEQFYWLWPLAFVALWRYGRSRRGRILLLGGLTGITFLSAPVIAVVWGPDAAYWSTPARAGEILVGAFVGLVLAGRHVPVGAGVLAPLGLLVLAAAVALFPTRGGPAYAGMLPAIGVVTAVLLVGLQAESTTRRWCSVLPLVWLGKISYGVYLYHWPIFVVINEDRVGVNDPLLLCIQLAVTLVAAQISYMFFERPIRHGLLISPRTTLIGGGVAIAVVFVLTVTVVPAASGVYWEVPDAAVRAVAIRGDATDELVPAGRNTTSSSDPNADVHVPAEEQESSVDRADVVSTDRSHTELAVVDDGASGHDLNERSSDLAAPEAGTEDSPFNSEEVQSIPELGRPARIIVAGDSTATAFGSGMVQWAADEPNFAQVEVWDLPGCGFVRGGEILIGGEWVGYEDGCERYFYEHLVEGSAELGVDVVVLMTTAWDVVDRRWPEDGAAEDSSVISASERVVADYGELTDRLLNAGVQVIWVEMPRPDIGLNRTAVIVEESQRHGVLHDAMALIAAASERVHVLDFDSWFSAEGFDHDRQLRPDGIHVTSEASKMIARNYFGDRLLRIVSAG